MNLSNAILSAAVAVSLLACDAGPADREDVVLARVHDQELFLSHARKYLLPGLAPEDSISQLRAYVEQWVRDAILLEEAKRYLPEELDIEDLVDDYRSSLIIGNFEKEYVEAQVDTVITNAELSSYYEANKDQYQLEQPILRCHFVKLPKNAEDRGRFREWWNTSSPEEDEFQQMIDYCSQYAESYILEDSTWYKVDEIVSLMPKGTFSDASVRPNTTRTFSDDEFEYYLRIFESLTSTEIAPLSFIREQAIRYIMHKRKLELLDRLKRELYQQGMGDDQISIFVE